MTYLTNVQAMSIVYKDQATICRDVGVTPTRTDKI